MNKSMDKRELTNKNSTYEEYEKAVYQILLEETPDEGAAIKKAIDSEKEDGKQIWHYARGKRAGSAAWAIGLLVE